MISSDDIRPIGAFLKTHGIKGELVFEYNRDCDLDKLSCVVVDIDGIFVPFYIDGIRPKAVNTKLLHIEDINNEADAREFVGKDLYALTREYEPADDSDEDGIYASDCIGFSIFTEEGADIGIVEDYDDSTENVLFKVQATDGREAPLYIPVAFITDLDVSQKSITMCLPHGLMDL